MGSDAILGCKIWLGKEKMEKVSEFKYLGTILCKHGSMEGEIRERTVRALSHGRLSRCNCKAIYPPANRFGDMFHRTAC